MLIRERSIGKDIDKLLKKPTSKWKKDDWIKVAQFLANKARPENMIGGIIYDGVKDDLSDHVNKHGTVESRNTARRQGRPEKLTKEKAEYLLGQVESKRKKLAQEKKVSPSKITYKEVAMSFAEYFKASGKGGEPTKISKYQLAAKLENWIKSMKRKVKSG